MYGIDNGVMLCMKWIFSLYPRAKLVVVHSIMKHYTVLLSETEFYTLLSCYSLLT